MINEPAFMLKKDGTPTSRCLCRNPELIENYDKAISDTSQVWECHHRLETHNSDGERRLVDITQKELIALGMYYDRPPKELIFLSPFEHMNLTHKGKHRSEEYRAKISETLKGKHASEETRKKMSDAQKGENNGMYGKHHSEESKRKMSEAKKGKKMSDEFRKKMSESRKGKHWKLVDGKRVYY